jgi:quinol monooxygenase YgiN
VEGDAVNAAGSYVVVVEFSIRPERIEAFRPAMSENARRSLADEPGCVQFDVCADPADATRILLYERYVDEAAFRAHLASPHFLAFDRTVAPWIAAKRVWTLQRIEPA